MKYTTPKWLKKFIKINELQEVQNGAIDIDFDIDIRNNKPTWFSPKIGLKAFSSPNNFGSSIYFIDLKTGYLLFHEIQL